MLARSLLVLITISAAFLFAQFTCFQSQQSFMNKPFKAMSGGGGGGMGMHHGQTGGGGGGGMGMSMHHGQTGGGGRSNRVSRMGRLKLNSEHEPPQQNPSPFGAAKQRLARKEPFQQDLPQHNENNRGGEVDNYIDTKSGQYLPKETEFNGHIENEMLKNHMSSYNNNNENVIVLNVSHSDADTCDNLMKQQNKTNGANVCECERVEKKICVFDNAAPSPTLGSHTIYGGCYKMSFDVLLDKDYICQSIRFCSEKKCDAIYHDGEKITFLKCYYGQLPVSKSDYKHKIFTLSDGC